MTSSSKIIPSLSSLKEVCAFFLSKFGVMLLTSSECSLHCGDRCLLHRPPCSSSSSTSSSSSKGFNSKAMCFSRTTKKVKSSPHTRVHDSFTRCTQGCNNVASEPPDALWRSPRHLLLHRHARAGSTARRPVQPRRRAGHQNAAVYYRRAPRCHFKRSVYCWETIWARVETKPSRNGSLAKPRQPRETPSRAKFAATHRVSKRRKSSVIVGPKYRPPSHWEWLQRQRVSNWIDSERAQ